MYIDNSNKTSRPDKNNTEKAYLVDMAWVKPYVEQEIAKRALARVVPIVDWMRAQKIYKFTIAGGALYKGDCNDIDIWPCPYDDVAYTAMVKKHVKDDGTSVHQFHEVDFNGVKAQFCLYPNLSVEKLIDGFDFAHCKAGAAIDIDKETGKVTAAATVTPEFIAAMAVQGTFYCEDHRFPLRSLYRVAKVAKKLDLTSDETKDLGCQVVASILNTGLTEIAQKDDDFVQWIGKYGDKKLPPTPDVVLPPAPTFGPVL